MIEQEFLSINKKMMNIHFTPNKVNTCYLCGSTEELTGEHKFKRKALSDTFGSDQMLIGTTNEPTEKLRTAQGVKSKAFHFKSKLCKECNGHRTQDADRALDTFLSILKNVSTDSEMETVFLEGELKRGSPKFQNLSMYFSKLLCGHLADSNAPRIKRAAYFAIGRTNVNPISLELKRSKIYHEIEQLYPGIDYLNHTGLSVQKNNRINLCNIFGSSSTFNSFELSYSIRLSLTEQFALHLCHNAFSKKCLSAIDRAILDADNNQ